MTDGSAAVDRDAELAGVEAARLESFVVRARRIEAHSLAADAQRLLGWAQGRAQMTMGVGSPAAMSRNLPDEEALDSLAARCRPFILQSESVYHAKVMKGLGYLLRDNETYRPYVRSLRASWQKLDPSSTSPLGFDSQTAPIGAALGQPVTDIALAYAWLYGDLVHNDDITSRVDGHDLDARYFGAVLVVGGIAVHGIGTLNLIRQLHAEGVLHLDESVFTERISPRTDYSVTVAGFALAPVGTPRDQLIAMLDDARAAPNAPEPDKADTARE